MQNKVIVEKGRTILRNNTKNKVPNIKKMNGTILDEMQSVFDKVENGYNNPQTTVSSMNISSGEQQNSNYNPMFNQFNTNSLATLLPLLKNLGGKNTSNITNIMSSLPNLQNGGNNMSLISQLLPLLQNLGSKTKKETTDEVKIDALTKADQNQ